MAKVKSFNLKAETRIGNYRIIENIGRGWEGEVYKVAEVPTEAIRALKLFRTDELNSIRHLIHIAWYYEQVRPTGHFPAYYHYGQWFLDDDCNGCWFLVFEFVEGTTLKQVLEGNTHSKEDVFFCLASALADVHEYGYAVGDFETLENVIVANDKKDKCNRIVFIDCDPGEPDKPNSDYRGDCHELVSVSRVFGKSKPSKVKALLRELKSRQRFGQKTLSEILKGLTTA